MKNTVKNDSVGKKILKGLHKFVDALQNDRAITEVFTCRKMTLDLHPMRYTGETVKSTRQLLRASQAVFAQFLGVKPSTIQAWEQNRQTPPDIACRFMDEIQRDPEYWRKLKDSIRVKESC